MIHADQEIFGFIDILIDMANKNTDIDDINTELFSLKKQINKKKNELEDLQEIMVDARYFNASDELVDKNIEISLKNKISRINRKLKDLESSLEDIKTKEKEANKDVNVLNERLESNEKYIEALSKKAGTTNANTYYIDLLTKEEENVKDLKEQLGDKSEYYNDILKELELNNQAFEELQTKLEDLNARLNEIEDSLNNPNSYIDEDLKRLDEERQENLKKEIENLEKRRLELLTDVNVIGRDAKDLIVEGNVKEATNKIKELLTIVKSQDYMDVTDKSILDEELEKIEQEQLELSTVIDNVDYDNKESNPIAKRIDYLNNEIANSSKSIKTYEIEMANIDEFVHNTLSVAIAEIEEKIVSCEKELTSYKNLLTEKNRRKSLIENNINKKEKEKNILNDILASYKEDLLNKIDKTTNLESIINTLKNEVKNYGEELKKLSRLSYEDYHVKDITLEEQTKDKLKALNAKIKAIKNRQRFDSSPDEIYNSIIELLKQLPKKDTIALNENIDNLFDIDNAPTTKSEKIKVVKMIPAYSNVGGGN